MSKRYVPPHLRNKLINEKTNENDMNRFKSTPPSVKERREKKASKRWNFEDTREDNSRESYYDDDRRRDGRDGRRDGGRDGRNGGGYFGRSNGGSYSRYNQEVNPFDEESSKTKTVGINFSKYDKIPVEITGDEKTEPILSFEKSELHESVKKNLERANFLKPTPIQKFSIPIALKGNDIMACAQTGSGKTASFLLPIISRIVSQGPSRHPSSATSYERNKALPSCVIMAPTRELCIQIFDDTRKFCYKTGLIPQVVYGGESASIQIRNLSRGCHIVVATPGRLVDLMDRGKITLSGANYLILDEADRMLDMGFEPQIRYIVEEEKMPTPEKRQTLLFSATFPKEIQQLAGDFLGENYIFITVGKVGSTTDFITQVIEYIDYEEDKQELLLGLLKKKPGKTLVFTETKRTADWLEDFLHESGVKCEAIHGGRDQSDRLSSLNKFKRGRVDVLVATSVASRGLDIDNVTHVINYELPSDIQDYTHRIGRTGRLGHEGLATAFFTDKNKNILKGLHKLLSENNQEIPKWLSTMVKQGGFSGGKYKKKSYGSRDYRGNKNSYNYNGKSGGGNKSSGGGYRKKESSHSSGSYKW